MPGMWSAKDERQYRHIRDNQVERGVEPTLAQEIAARTVNKQRRQSGRTPNRRSQGTGNPNSPLETLTVDELRNRARLRNIPGRSRMRKNELIAALESRAATPLPSHATTRAIPPTQKR
jgi:cobalamin biosynthesis Mg chelatase CobN